MVLRPPSFLQLDEKLLMSDSPSDAPMPSLPEAPMHGIQPGGGMCVHLELAWGAWRRWWLKRFCPGYVAAMQAKRQGICPDCPGKSLGCRGEVIDSRDLKFFRNVCGYSFAPEDDGFRHRDRWPLARWGLGEVVIATLICLLLSVIVSGLMWFGLPVWLGSILSFLILIGWLFILSFFRDPERTIPSDPYALVSPADGKVTHVEEVSDPDFPEGKALRISIFLSVFNVHVNRAPRTGRVERIRYFPGEYFNAMKAISAVKNEQLWIDFWDEALQGRMRLKQIAGAIARRIVCPVKVGDQWHIGDRIGMIKIGSRTEIYLPINLGAEPIVKVGDVVHGGSSILLRFKSRSAKDTPAPLA